jgi:hypothetical protein
VIDVEIRSRTPGTTGAGMPAVLVGLASVRTTVRELIARAVAEQVRELRVDAARCRTTLDRQYLSDAEIRRQAATGAVRYPAGVPPTPDPDREAARAQRAFADGVFVVFLGDRQVRELDEEIELRLGEPVTFLRLTPLVGG